MINPPSTNFAEQWVKQYSQLNRAISYKSFDFNGIKRSLIDYLRTYHPEHFNNLTETDELLPLIELFAYVGELYAYRSDVNTQENILSAVTRKSSGIQIANMLGYAVSRRTTGVGLVKLTSVSTSESIMDSDGSDLKQRVVHWADQANSRWKSQFEIIISRVLNSTAGVSSDLDKTQIENVTFERYVMNTTDLIGGVHPYSITVNGVTMPMELVGTSLGTGVVAELPPTGSRPLDILFANDGFGDTSPTTGYMFLTKQGVLSSTPIQFTGGVVNLTQPVNASGINDTDLWLNAVTADGTYTSSWEQVDNIAYNANSSRNTYQVVSQEGDRVLLVFGDGNYSAIPSGNFEIWYRTSIELDSSIPASAVVDQRFSVDYLDSYGNTQTFTCTFSLQSAIVTSSASETLDQLKQAVPGVFYTQDRMVNAQDHQNYLLQDPSVIKIKAVNRTFAGHSKYSSWFDGSESYENVKVFSNDGVVYLDISPKLVEVLNPNSAISYTEFVAQNLTDVLLYPDLWVAIGQRLSIVPTIREYFTPLEQAKITTALQTLVSGGVIGLSWTTSQQWSDPQTSPSGPVDIDIRLLSGSKGWLITAYTCKTVIHSSSTRFWQYSSTTGTDYDTTNPTNDTVTILKANPNRSRSGTLAADLPFRVANNILLQTVLPNQASFDLAKLELVDTTPELTATTALAQLMNTEYVHYVQSPPSYSIALPSKYIVGYGDIASVVRIRGVVKQPIAFTEPSYAGSLSQTITIAAGSLAAGDTLIVTMRDWVYFQRDSINSAFAPTETTDSVLYSYVSAQLNSDPAQKLCYRRPGRRELNFLWQHFTDEFELINPARTNITDLYVVTKQYFTDFMRWLRDATSASPTLPSVLQLTTAYSKYTQKAMMSDEIVLRPGKFKILFGPKSEPRLRATIQLILPSAQQVAKDTVRQEIVTLIRKYFDISNVEFGDVFYFSNLSSYLHSNSKYVLGSVLLIPTYPGYQFGDLYELTAAPDEIFAADISLSDIQIVDQLTPTNIRQ